jgi:hypothetical protein
MDAVNVPCLWSHAMFFLSFRKEGMAKLFLQGASFFASAAVELIHDPRLLAFGRERPSLSRAAKRYQAARRTLRCSERATGGEKSILRLAGQT